MSNCKLCGEPRKRVGVALVCDRPLYAICECAPAQAVANYALLQTFHTMDPDCDPDLGKIARERAEYWADRMGITL